MIKLSDFPNGTISEIAEVLYRKEGDWWVSLDTRLGAVSTASIDKVQADGGHIAIVGIPYPVALHLAERLGGAYPLSLGKLNPEEIILDAAREIVELREGYLQHEADIDAIKAAEAQEELESEADQNRYNAAEAEEEPIFDAHIDSNHRWDTDRVLEIDTYAVHKNADGKYETDTTTTISSVRIPSLGYCVDTWVTITDLSELDAMPPHVRYAVNGAFLLAENIQKESTR